jgi:DNA mismatch repair protein MutS
MLIDDYIDYQIKYQEKYGEKTVILMQVGSFFEAYAIDNDKEKVNIDNLNQICDLMNIQISRKSKSVIENSRSNPLMAGFPLFAIEKFIQILMNHGYTVVLIEQVTEPPEPERKVTNIFSPGTSITYTPSEETSNLLSIYIETTKDLKNYRDIVCVGLSIIDLTTGKSIIYEMYSDGDDINKSFDEIYRFIQSHNPKEIVLNVNSCPLEKKKLITYLELNNKIFHYKEGKEIDKFISKISYQKTLLEKIFTDHGLLSVHEYLDLEKKQLGTISFVALLQFAHEHNETVINKLEKPEIWESNRYLILTNDSINQLNLVDNSHQQNINNKFNSLFGIVNNASTAIGKRLLKDKLLNPIIDEQELNKRYQYLEELKFRNPEGGYYYKDLETYLIKIMDIERLHRRMSLKLLQPADFTSLDIAYSNIRRVFEHPYLFSGELKNLLPSESTKNKFYNFIEEYRSLFDMDEIAKYHLTNISDSFFLKGNIKEIDELQEKINGNRLLMKELADKLSYFIEKNSEYVKVEHNDKEGHYLQTTKKRGEALKKSFENTGWKKFKLKDSDVEINPKDLDLKFLKDRTKITSNYFISLSFKLRAFQEQIKAKTTEIYLAKLEYFYSEYGKVLKEIANFVGHIDFFKSNAKTATLFGYHRPKIVNNSEQSFLDAKELRHPIIERIQTDCEYVPNDICLGKGEDKLNGMLLYGCNAVGKSSMMKAIGLNIIMAQSGLFVASREFIFNPFHYIFTRISDNDNIFKGQSSFAVEMSELRSILKRSNQNSIVLGDELCSGTESVSAQSIFASSVVRLSEKNVNFVFATHLHELYKLPLIQNLENVKSFHLKVIFDEENKKLIYDRKLEEGNGPAIYGLEVCKAMDLDPDFLTLANSIRRDLLGISDNLQEKKQSPYNKRIYLQDCSVCGEKAVDTHHIKEQNTADKDNMIGHIKKNQESNLVALCEDCHHKVHNGDLDIQGYMKTTHGIELDYKQLAEVEIEDKLRSKKKYNQQQVDIIRGYKKLPNTSMKKACIMLEEKNSIKISSATLKKIWNDCY